MSEDNVKDSLISAIQKYGGVCNKIESPTTGSGIADISFVFNGSRGGKYRACGWIETKYLKSKPKRSKIVRIEHYTREQAIWLYQRSLFSWLFIKIEHDYYLMDGCLSLDLSQPLKPDPEEGKDYGFVCDLDRMKELSSGFWSRRLNPLQLVETLCN